jgi:hydroxymethylglutaryl-CoA reductase (NADPH)
MSVSRKIAATLLDELRARGQESTFSARLAPRLPGSEPLPEAVPRDEPGRSLVAERRALLARRDHPLPTVCGERVEIPLRGFRGNIENFIGVVQVPVGLIGPLRISGLHAHGDFYVPMATTEGALVASHARGATAIAAAGGVRAMCQIERVTRAPLFRFRDMTEAGAFVAFALDSFARLEAVAATTTRHGRLVDVRVHWDANRVTLLCDYTTGDAAGQNMVTLATDAVCRWLVDASPVKPRFWTVEGNMSGDKKGSGLAMHFVRGKRVTAEVELAASTVADVLHTTPEAMHAYWCDGFVAASQSGCLGGHGQFANGLAAVFLACGQDVACVAEAAVGTSRFEVTETGSLYVSVNLPNLIVGTVGGGTATPTAAECLALLSCAETGSAARFAEICAAVVLAGEISIVAALSSGEFASAHRHLARRL